MTEKTVSVKPNFINYDGFSAASVSLGFDARHIFRNFTK